jgi:hypothetical protein
MFILSDIQKIKIDSSQQMTLEVVKKQLTHTCRAE